MKPTLKHMVDNLTLQDKVELRDYLIRTIHSSSGVTKSPLRASILLGEMAKVIGVESIPHRGRESNIVWARTMVAYQMLREGYSTTEIGRQMEKNHSTIQHLWEKMRSVFELPQAYGDIIDTWDKFQKHIQDDIHN